MMKRLLSLFLAVALCGNSALAGISGQWIGGKGSIHSIASGSSISLSSVNAVISSSSVKITGTSSKTLANGSWGFYYSTGTFTGTYTFTKEAIGDSQGADSQQLIVPEADLGAGSGTTINVQIYYTTNTLPGLTYGYRILVGSNFVLTGT